MFDIQQQLLAEINKSLNHAEDSLKQAIHTINGLHNWDDSDLPYPHLDPEDDPSWVEPEAMTRVEDIIERPF